MYIIIIIIIKQYKQNKMFRDLQEILQGTRKEDHPD